MFIQSVTQATRKKIRVLPTGVEPMTWLLLPDALPLIYKRLMRAKAIKLLIGSCDKQRQRLMASAVSLTV